MPRVTSPFFWVSSAAIALAVACGDGELLNVGLVQPGSGGTNDHLAGEGGSEAGRGQDDGGSAAADDGGTTGGAGAKGGKGGKGGTGSGGTSENGGSSALGNAGGDAGQDTSGGTAGSSAGGAGGTAGGGGTSGDTSSMAGAAGEGEPDPTMLDICSRIEDSTLVSIDLTDAFEDKVIADCRVHWVTYLYYDSANGVNERPEYLNQLLNFNFAVWGCRAKAPDSFDLIYGTAPLSLADATALIDSYVSATDETIDVTGAELDDLRVVLENLSEPLLIEPDPGDFTDNRCPTGGEGGSDSGGAGQAGTP